MKQGTKDLQWEERTFGELFGILSIVVRIFVAKYKDEEAHFVQGQHEVLISERLFYQVMDVLDGRKNEHTVRFNAKTTNEKFLDLLKKYSIEPKGRDRLIT